MLGLKPTQHLPVEGMPPRLIQGIRIWVEPQKEPGAKVSRRNKRSTHRVMAECPICLKVMSAGRLHQHAEIHAHWRVRATAHNPYRTATVQFWNEAGRWVEEGFATWYTKAERDATPRDRFIGIGEWEKFYA
jgi:hypothetical protein